MITFIWSCGLTVNFPIAVKAYVLKNIISYLSEQKVNVLNRIEVQLYLADPQFNTLNKVNILLEDNVYSQILKDGINKSPSGTLIKYIKIYILPNI